MKNPAVYAALTLAWTTALFAQDKAPLRPATINVQAAILSTKEGQKATQDLQSKFASRRQALERKQAELAAMQSKMRVGSATMTPQAKDKLIADIDAQTKAWNRDSTEYNEEVQQEQGRIMDEVGQKILEVIEKYSTEHGLLLVADVSNPQTPILWSDSTLDITTDIIRQYDQTHPAAAAAPASPAPAAPAPKKQ